VTAPAAALLGTATVLATGAPALARPFSAGEKSGVEGAWGRTHTWVPAADLRARGLPVQRPPFLETKRA